MTGGSQAPAPALSACCRRTANFFGVLIRGLPLSSYQPCTSLLQSMPVSIVLQRDINLVRLRQSLRRTVVLQQKHQKTPFRYTLREKTPVIR
jgi:hypothetical protein